MPRGQRRGFENQPRAPSSLRSSSDITMQSRPARPNASLSLPSACLKLPFQSSTSRSRAGPVQAVPSSTPSTVDITWVMASIWRFRVLPRLVSCSGLAPYIVIVLLHPCCSPVDRVSTLGASVGGDSAGGERVPLLDD